MLHLGASLSCRAGISGKVEGMSINRVFSKAGTEEMCNAKMKREKEMYLELDFLEGENGVNIFRSIQEYCPRSNYL